MKKIILGLLVCSFCFVSGCQKWTLDNECQAFGEKFLEGHKSFSADAKHEFFYSKRCDTCLMTEVDVLGNAYTIYDIKRNFSRATVEDQLISFVIFNCDKSGCDNVILEKFEKLKDKAYRTSIKEYMDNFEGGLPRALKTPAESYSREKCEKLFKKKLKEVR